MLSVTDYGALIADPVRMGAFTTGLKRTVTPDSVVIDLGTGTGICALIACALGARKVYAIESDDVIEVARSIAATNGYADRIEFHHAVSGDVVLPERGDVIVADMAGMLPWFHRGILSIIDARRRMLKPQGVVLPQRDVVGLRSSKPRRCTSATRARGAATNSHSIWKQRATLRSMPGVEAALPPISCSHRHDGGVSSITRPSTMPPRAGQWNVLFPGEELDTVSRPASIASSSTVSRSRMRRIDRTR